MSAGTRLLLEGAEGVLIVPIARMITAGYAGENPDRYRVVLAGDYDPEHWPLD